MGGFALAQELPPMTSGDVIAAITDVVMTYGPSEGVEAVPAIIQAVQIAGLEEVVEQATAADSTDDGDDDDTTILASRSRRASVTALIAVLLPAKAVLTAL